ncbi:MAG: M56 family metallopeptidase, partial [Verrucomicrobiales bacterium]|nr:M56 family metallopeptidase [Verrucomicrobiales bacterium]
MIDLVEQLDHPLLLASRDAAVLALGIGLILLIFGRRMSPLWRHRLWLLVALRLLLPVLPTSPTSWKAFLPSESVQLFSEAERVLPNQAENVVSLERGKVEKLSDVYVDESLALSSGVERAEQGFRAAQPSSAPQDLQKGTKWSLGEILVVTWAVGFATLLIFIGIVTWRFYRRLRCLTLAAHPRFAEIRLLLEEICRETGFRRVPKLRITEAIHSPALTGLIRPEILLPPGAVEALTAAELRLVLLHELGHLHRRDVWVNWLMALLQALHWFNPLLWWAFHRIRIESERATDAWVLQHSGVEQAETYGQTLIQLLKASPSASIAPGVVAVVESRRDLRSRIRAIGSFSGKHNRWATWCAGLLLLAVAAVGLTQAPDEGEETAVFEFEVDVLVLGWGNPVPGAVVRLYLFDSPDTYMRGKMIYEGKTDQNAEFKMAFEAPSMCVMLQVENADGQLRGGRILYAKTEELFRPQDAIDELHKDLWRQQPLYPTQLVSMRFLHENGEPIYPLSLHVQSYGIDPVLSMMHPVLEDLETDEGGRCTVRLPFGHQVIIKHDRHDLTNIKVNRGSFVPPENGSEVIFTLSPAYTLKGQVALPDGTPVDAGITNNLLG